MNALNESTKEQKLAIVSALDMISQGTENSIKRDYQVKMIQKTLREFGLSQAEWSTYIQALNPESFQKVMMSLSPMENEFYLAYIFELLHQNGSPNHREESVAKNACQNICGISNSQFDKTMQKFQNMGNAFM